MGAPIQLSFWFEGWLKLKRPLEKPCNKSQKTHITLNSFHGVYIFFSPLLKGGGEAGTPMGKFPHPRFKDFEIDIILILPHGEA